MMDGADPAQSNGAAPSLVATEIAEDKYVGLDTWEPQAILEALLDGQRRALEAVAPAISSLASAAEVAAGKLASGGRLVYLASGSPALISLSDALELPGTYGIPRDRILLIFAGGEAITRNLTGVEEDDGGEAERQVAAHALGTGDCVIATSASGSTPFTVAGLRAAAAAGAATVGIAGNPDAPLLRAAGIPVLLPTGAEVISGSTRMGAGTAQKVALNLLSTLIGVRLGHVYDGLMVNVVADNEKLRGRASRIVSRITGVDTDTAAAALAQAEGAVKPAVLLAAGAPSLAAAKRLLGESGGNVRSALARVAG